MQTMNREKIKQHKGKMVIIDNNMLIDFKEINSKFNKNLFPILKSIFSQLLIPDIYYFELETETAKIVLLNKIEKATLKTEKGFGLLKKLLENKIKGSSGLTEYDKYLVSLSKEYNALCGTNDGAIRKICDRLKIETIGTIGILACCYENNSLGEKEFESYLKFLFSSQSSCFLSPKIKQEILSLYKISD